MNIGLARTVIIAGDAEFAEQVCSRLRKPGEYLPVIEAPLVRLVEYGVFDQDCVRVANAVRNLDARTFLCLKVPSEVLAKLRECMPDVTLVALETYDEARIAEHACLNRFATKYQDLLLKDAARCTKDVFVVEGQFGFTTVIAANLAAAHRGRVAFVSAVTEDDIELVKEEWRLWSNGSFEERLQAKKSLLGFLQSRLPAGLIMSRAIISISFVTDGLPYGALPFACPTTHFFSFPLLGLSVLAGMLKSRSVFRSLIAVLIDPSLVGQSEFETLRETLGRAGYVLRQAFGQNATAKYASYLTAYLPSDLIFYSTHCGEVKGQRVVERFPDRDGNLHTVCYERVLSGFRSPTDDLFEITTMKSWLSLDGVEWGDEARKEEIEAGELIKDYIDYSRNMKRPATKPDFISITDSGRVRDSDSLAMCGGLSYLPLPRMVGGCHYPLVFNNACSSWRALASRFGCGGASVCGGTATDILGTSFGVTTANKFVSEITSGRAAGVALYRSQKNLIAESGYTPYLMNGYLYTRLDKPPVKQRRRRAMLRILDAIEAANREPASEGKPGVLKFLKDELSAFANMQVQS